MAIYFTDTMPYSTVHLDYTVSELEDLLDQGTPYTHHLNIGWDITYIDEETAHQWCIDNNFITILLKGYNSIKDFKDHKIGNESVFEHAPNRQSGPPLTLSPGDHWLVMDRRGPKNIIRWKLINNVKIFSDVAKPFIDDKKLPDITSKGNKLSINEVNIH